jgi:hypothetical protein
MRLGECVSTFCRVLLEQNKSKTFPPKFYTIFRVLELKTLKIRRGAVRKKGVARCIYIYRNNRGRHYKENHLLITN